MIDLHEYMEEVSKDTIEQTVIAKIDKVYTDEADGDPQLAVDAHKTDFSKHFHEIPVVTGSHSGQTVVPEEGDFALIGQLEGDGQDVGVYSIVHADPLESPHGVEGDWRHEFKQDDGDNLYLEAEKTDHTSGTPNVIRIAKKPDGLSDPTTEVALDDSGTEPEVRISGEGSVTINVDGDVTINANGSITIGEGGEKVAIQEHTHVDGNGNTTSTPNESGTDTKVK